MTTGIIQRYEGKTKFHRLFLKAETGLVAAADNLIGDAVNIKEQISVISTCDGAGDSSILPLAKKGDFVLLVNDGAAAARVYASGSDTIDGVAAGTGVVLGAVSTRALFVAVSDGAWYSLAGIKSA